MKIKIVALTAALTLCLSGLAFAGSVEVKGSTTVLPLMQKSAEAFMAQNKGVNVSISGGGSSEGAKALIDGTCDIAMMSRDMKDKEIEAATANGRAPKLFVVAYDCIVPIVHPGNAVKDLSVAQLQDIYAGKITNWKDVGGADAQIVVISRDTSSGTYDCWENKVMHDGGKKERVFPGALLQASNGAVVQAVSKNKLAIGYIGLGYLNKEIKQVSVGGVMGDATTALNKTYPVSRGLNLYTPGEPKGDAKGLVDFMLSPAGQKLADEIGFVPLKK
ncbi:MAG TPA: PstS family phosphate ABC transporter substrate-binding protein [Desulfovibrio sp.]|uniref:PstS family phosphate ABC transporter substrate-binding protein n=1 Tax=Desulfovibrio sp. TaxID=885 RepID=UPI002BAF641A|nr:PstS family phosphate ABC transporter substrate-binding protein [Desulfovibrio sp.]HMM39456.1 PstS family phosphate ABC transporter substrate-binding protein [Desulfovibrio sp.]